MISKGKGRQIRSRGNQYERKIASEMRNLGFKKCITSRYGSKERDDQSVDLLHTEPFNFQLKCKNNYGNPIPVLGEMPKDANYNVIISKVVGKGEFVTLSKSDFYELVEMLKGNKII